MKEIRLLPALLLLLSASIVSAQDKGKGPVRRDGTMKVGDAAVDFQLHDADGKSPVKLADLKGKPVVLIFGSCT